MIGLSTCYYDKIKYPTWHDILLDIKKTGFFDVELDVDIPETWIQDIRTSVFNNEIRILSVHNPCPTLGKDTYFYSLSSKNEENRELAVKYTLKSIELACELGAKAVVVHLGEIETAFSGRDLYKYTLNFDLNKNNGNKFLERQKIEVWIERQRNANIYLENSIKSLDEIVNFASKKRIKIGIENRPYITDIPSIEEAKNIIETFNTKYLGYWHDVGHAEISSRLGYVENHTHYLEILREYLIGIHIHDIKKISDHFLPGLGDFDFRILKPFINQEDDIIKILEVHKFNNSNDIKKSIKILSKLDLI